MFLYPFFHHESPQVAVLAAAADPDLVVAEAAGVARPLPLDARPSPLEEGSLHFGAG